MGLLGAHVSVTGGVDLSPERARDLGCDSMQIFTRNQMQWKARKIAEDEAFRFRENVKRFRISRVMVHDSYLINLAATDDRTLRMSREAFLDEMRRAGILGIDFLVFHPGSHLEAGESKGMKKIADNVRDLLKKTDDGEPRLLFETTAGQGTNLGYSFEQIANMIDGVGIDERTGVCLDTCHSYSAGYDLTTDAGYARTFQMFDETIGLERLFGFHVNDSKNGLGSRKDRHENIGKGKMGLGGFERLVNDGRFSGHPMVLETPGGDDGFREDLRMLRNLLKKKGKA